MKTSIAAALICLASASASAQTSVSLQTGQVFKDLTKVSTLSLEHKAFGLNFGTDVQVGRNQFKAIDLTVGKDLFNVGYLNVSTKAGIGYLNPSVATNGYVGVLGVQVGLPLSKQVSVVASSTRDFGLQGNKAISYTSNQVGIKYIF